jgi:HlyD family secretion protein
MKRGLIAVVVIAALAAVVLGSIYGGKDEGGERVYVEPVVREDITEVVKASGEIQARVSVDLSAHVVAKIERLYVEEGQTVAAGQPFLELEKEAFTAATESWEAQLRQAQTGVRQAEVALADSEVKLRRARRLAEEGITSTEQLEAAELERTSAELSLEEARDRVANTRASLTKARDDLGKTTLYAPIAGRVVELNAEEGEVVVSGMMNNPATKIATVADLSELLAELDVDENEIVDVALGQEVEVTVDALPDRVYRGRVVEVGSSGSTRPGQGDVTFFEVDVLLENADDRLRPGMSVRADIQTATGEAALVVPVQAVVERERGAEDEEGEASPDAETVQVVYVVEDGVAGERRVETGLSTVTDVEILEGLEEGEQVVTGPFRTLRDLEDGDAVRVSDESDRDDEDEEDE